MRLLRLGLLFSVSCEVLFGQIYRAELPHLTALDLGGHIAFLNPKPQPGLKLPNVPENPRFFSIGVVVMVVSTLTGDSIYIDQNRNNNLGDDGPPLFFHRDSNKIVFGFCPKDPLDTLIYCLARRPELPDTILKRIFDSEGNLAQSLTKFWITMRYGPDFTGKEGTFYFDDWLNTKRGTIAIDNRSYDVGVTLALAHDPDFGNPENTLLIDLNRDHIFDFLTGNEAFKLKDVFFLGGKNLRVRSIDTRGTYLELETTDLPTTSHYLNERTDQIASSGQFASVDPSIWNLHFTTLDGNAIKLSDYRGRFLLLNFWGEWCQPCIQEIPDLVEANKTLKSVGLSILGLIKIVDRKKAERLISAKGINWPQVSLTKELEEKFMVQSYPTNVLILPNGTAVRTLSVNMEFLRRHLP